MAAGIPLLYPAVVAGQHMGRIAEPARLAVAAVAVVRCFHNMAAH